MSLPSPTTVSVLGAVAGTTVEIVPGKKIVPLPSTAVPPLAVADWVPAGDGTFRFVARVLPRWHTLNARNLRLLNIAISHNTLLRLMEAGFIEARRPGPNVREFNFDSYLAHVERTRDPEFWSRKEPGERFTNFERFKQVSVEFK